MVETARMNHRLRDPASIQRLLYEALDGSDNIVIVLEQSGNGASAGLSVVAANDAFCRTSGFTQADLVGQPFLTLLAPDANPATWAAMVRSAREHRSYRSELLCTRRDGASFWLGLHLMPARERSPWCVLLGRDITVSLRDRQQHAAIQGLLAKVFLCVQAAVAIIDENGLIQMTNPALDRLMGYPSGSLPGKSSIDFVAPDDRPIAAAARQRQLESGHDYTIETTAQRGDGSTLPVELTSTMMAHENLKRVRIVTLTPRGPATMPPPVKVHVAGKFRLIGLEEVMEALGPRWAEVSSRVMASAELVLLEHCRPSDSWSRTTDCGFLVCFGGATEEDAQVRAAAIARDIRIRLIGEGETESNAYVTAITGSVEVPNRPPPAPDMLAAVIGERLNARLAEIEARARETLRQAIQTATSALSPVYNRHMREMVGLFATLPRALEHAVNCALAALPMRESQAFEFDRLVLGVAAAQVIDRLATGDSQPIMVPVNFELFLDQTRADRYIEAWQQLDRRLRQRMMLVLAHLPRGVPRSKILECVTRLRRFSHAVGFQAEAVELPPIEFSALGASIVVVQEEDLKAWEFEDLTKLEKLVGVVHAHHARVLMREVGSRESAAKLLRLGADLIALAENAG